MSKAKHCDECRHATIKQYLYCAKGHKPRFYMPRNDNPLDLNWGWKRVCADFETANAAFSGPGAEAPQNSETPSPESAATHS